MLIVSFSYYRFIPDIPVFQMMLGPFQLLRRIDSDFVNLSPIIAYSGTAGIPTSTAGAGDSGITERSDNGGHPSSPRSSPAVAPSTNVVTNATVITSGSPEICGTWVTLAAAQAYVRDHLSSGENVVARRALELFLSDALVERFPSALQDFHRLNAGLRALNQFGRHFESTLMVAGGGGVGVLDCAVKISGRSEEEEEGKGVAAAAAFTDGLVQRDEGGDAPLSKTEQDLFHELCDFPPDCDGGEEMMVVDSGDTANVPALEEHQQDVLLPLLAAAMDVDKLVFPTIPATANPTAFGSTNPGPTPVSPPPRRSMHAKKGSVSSISSLSSDSDMMALSTSTVMPKPVKASSSALAGNRSPPVMESLKEKSDGKPLRRSKRVADLAAAQPPQSSGVQTSTRAARSRKGGSIS